MSPMPDRPRCNRACTTSDASHRARLRHREASARAAAYGPLCSSQCRESARGWQSTPTHLSATRAQIFRLDFASAEAEMPAAGGSVTAPERFERLAWGAIGLDPQGLPVRGLLSQP